MMYLRHLFLGLLFGAASVQADDEWPEWRGPHGNGSLPEGRLVSSFSQEDGVAWKTPLSGRGCSTPIVSKGSIFLTAPLDGKDTLFSYDLHGKERWHQTYEEETPGRGQRVGSGANSSAVSDGEVVIAYFKSGQVAACSHDGKKLWEVNLQKEYGEDKLWWDQGTSPLLSKGIVVVAVMQTEGNSYLVAFDAKTGVVKWKTDRKFETAKESGDSYTTPHLVNIDGVDTVISFGADHLTGHDLMTGKQLWFSAGINPEVKGMWRTIASSVVSDGVVVVPHGRGEWLMGVKAGGKGEVTQSHVLWRKKITNTDAATPVARGGMVYILVDRGKDRGTVFCIDAQTGNEIWQGKLPKSPSTFYASPILVGDTLCCLREDGAVLMAKVSKDGLGEVTENRLEDTLVASPVFVNGKLLIRGDKHLYCIQ